MTFFVAAMAVAATFIGVRLWTVHEQTSDWALWPREVPSKVQFAGRDYNCGPVGRADTLNGLIFQGRTAGGGDIYAQPRKSDARVFIAVRTNGGVYMCNLLGGP
ncbi:hypothetical protein CVV68_22085 [Arthrobacter livingstonensis]|uniref:Uncharacterized protein n=1 Tax=Arthrobacter livingstonensis TaxID=670078 RepID=A0A2V5L023_9MICC|nr:hypothetical protein CVV68_22085 [Arthrobacter livingstonensis]